MYAPFQPSSLPSTHIQTKYRARACVCVCYDVRADMVLFPGGVAERTPQAFVPAHYRKRPTCLRALLLRGHVRYEGRSIEWKENGVPWKRRTGPRQCPGTTGGAPEPPVWRPIAQGVRLPPPERVMDREE